MNISVGNDPADNFVGVARGALSDPVCRRAYVDFLVSVTLLAEEAERFGELDEGEERALAVVDFLCKRVDVIFAEIGKELNDFPVLAERVYRDDITPVAPIEFCHTDFSGFREEDMLIVA